MQKLKSYTDIEIFLNKVTNKSNFTYNDTNYGVMVANDKKIIVRNFSTGITLGKKQFLESLDIVPSQKSYTPQIEEPLEPNPIPNSDYEKCFITPTILSTEFIQYMQIEAFRDEYEKHSNIGLFDFDVLKNMHSDLKVRNKKNVLYFRNEINFNISVKWSIDKGWYSVAGTKASLGAFFKANVETSTLVMCEGLKDGINGNILLEMADVWAVNGKSNKYDPKLYNIDLKKYKYIIFANDRDNEEHLLKMFGLEHKEHYKKTRYIDWSKIEKGKDLTDIIEHIILPKHPTKRDRKRGALATLKKLLYKESFYNEYKKLRIKEASKTLEMGISQDNKPMVMRAIKTLNEGGGNLLTGAKYYLQKQNSTTTNNNREFTISTTVEDGKMKSRLSNHTNIIVEELNKNNKVFLNAPTGTGKSYVSLQELPKYFKNIMIVSPLRMVTNEHGADEKRDKNGKIITQATPYTNVQFNDNAGGIGADLNSNYIAVTTDVFSKFKKKRKNDFSDRLDEVNLVLVDESHIVQDSQGFRDNTVVYTYDYLLKDYNGKVLFMSGTPILPTGVEVSLITAKVIQEAKEHINFYNNPFDSLDEIVQSIKEQLKSGAVLLYASSIPRVSEVEDLLIESGVKTLSITSYEYRLEGQEVDNTILEEDLGNIVYISTTKATTGVNFKHLKAIYQYGTTYTPNTFIQLMARLRAGGKYFLINPKYAKSLEEDNTKRAIGLSLVFQKKNVKKVSDIFHSEEFQKWLKQFVSLPHNNKNLKGFLKTYKKAFMLIEAKGLGKFNKINDDFEFTGHLRKNIPGLFENDEKNEFRKYIEQILIDWIVKNDVEMLNDYYNLSFVIHDATTKVSEESHQLITDNRKELKKEKGKELRDEKKELYESIDKKLESINVTAKLLKKHSFSDTEISKLNDIKIHLDKIKTIKRYEDKLTVLKFHLIPKKSIFEVSNQLIIDNSFLTIKDLDSALQKIFITNARKKNPYEKLLIEAFSNGLFNDSYFDFSDRKRIDKKQYYNVLTIAKEHKKHFEDLKTKKAKEKFLDDEMLKNIEKIKKENNYTFEIVVEDAPKLKAKVKSVQELIEEQERILNDESVSLEIKTKVMHQIAMLKGEVKRE